MSLSSSPLSPFSSLSSLVHLLSPFSSLSRLSLILSNSFLSDLLQVFSDKIRWLPKGSQSEWVGLDNPGPVQDDILLAKMRPGHEMNLRLFAYKGIGRDHAKFSPVATAFYR